MKEQVRVKKSGSSFIKIPPVCLAVSLVRLVQGRLRYSKQHLGGIIKMEDGQELLSYIGKNKSGN